MTDFLLKLIPAVIVALAPIIIENIINRNRGQAIAQAVELYKNLPAEFTDTKSDWRFYIKNETQKELGIQYTKNITKDIVRVFFGIIGLLIMVYTMPKLVNEKSIVPLLCYIAIFAIGTIVYAYNLIKHLVNKTTQTISPQRALKALRALQREAHNFSNLPDNDMLLRAWSHKVIIILSLALGDGCWITSDFSKQYKKLIPYSKEGQKNFDEDSPYDILKEELKILDAAIYRLYLDATSGI